MIGFSGGCGTGVLLDYLVQTKQVAAVGVDLDFGRVTTCVRRGLAVYQGDMTSFMRAFPDKHFDRVICSRTVHELGDPTAVINEALQQMFPELAPRASERPPLINRGQPVFYP